MSVYVFCDQSVKDACKAAALTGVLQGFQFRVPIGVVDIPLEAGGAVLKPVFLGFRVRFPIAGHALKLVFKAIGERERPSPFHLDPVPVEACKTLEKEQLGGWDNEPRR